MTIVLKREGIEVIEAPKFSSRLTKVLYIWLYKHIFYLFSHNSIYHRRVASHVRVLCSLRHYYFCGLRFLLVPHAVCGFYSALGTRIKKRKISIQITWIISQSTQDFATLISTQTGRLDRVVPFHKRLS